MAEKASNPAINLPCQQYVDHHEAIFQSQRRQTSKSRTGRLKRIVYNNAPESTNLFTPQPRVIAIKPKLYSSSASDHERLFHSHQRTCILCRSSRFVYISTIPTLEPCVGGHSTTHKQWFSQLHEQETHDTFIHADGNNLKKQLRKDWGDKMEEKKAAAAQEKLRELEIKFGDFELQIKQLGQVSGLKSEKRRFISSMDQHDEQVEELQQEIQELRRSLRKDNAQPSMDKRPKAIKEWLSEAEAFGDKRSWDGSSRLAVARRLRHEDSQIARRAATLAADGSTDAKEDILPDKEQWLRLHPFAPVANSPYALARYPHSPTLFATKHHEVSRRLDRILREELKKFGISPHAEGISDAKHAVVAAALEKQRAYRLSTAPLNERKIMEYERSTILWQIERAVHSRDMSILESIFDGGTESDSGNETCIEGPESEDEEILQSPSADRSERMVRGHDLDFEADFSGKRSTSCQGSDHSDVYGRLREHSQLSDVHSVTRNSLTRHSLDGLETHSFQVMGQLTAQRVPSISDDHQQQHNIVLSAVSSPTAKIPEHPFEHPEGNIGLGDWESEGEEHSSFAYDSPRRGAKGEQQDGASTSSKNREVYKDFLKG